MKIALRILKISLVVCLFVILMDSVFNGFNFDGFFNLDVLGMYYFYSLVLTAINVLYFIYFGKKIGWKKAGIGKLLLASGGSVVITLIGFFFCRIIDNTIFRGLSFIEFVENEEISRYYLPILITLIISLFFHAFYFYRALQEQKVKEQKIIAGNASAKFESLKNQIDPHFLFNSLNVLTSLIDENPEQAQKFTTSLSKIYRYVLEQKDKELVSLEEELAFATTYMKLLKMRFENSIFYEVQEAISSPEAKVVPLSLQLLLENTVKHNVVSEGKPLKIRVYEEDGYLVVENNLQKKDVLQNRKGVGLQNIVDRYAIITDRSVYVEENKEYFKVKIPVLTKQISIMETSNYSQDKAYFRAQQRVKEIKDFYGNLISYSLVIPFLIFINYNTYWGFQWFWFPMLGWGIGLGIHGFSVFGYGSSWEERKIKELMEKDTNNNTSWK